MELNIKISQNPSVQTFNGLYKDGDKDYHFQLTIDDTLKAKINFSEDMPKNHIEVCNEIFRLQGIKDYHLIS